MKQSISQKLIERYPNLGKIIGEDAKRASLILIGSLVAGLCFTIYNGVLAVVYKSSWNIVLGGYYFLLFVARIIVLFGFAGTRKNNGNAERRGAFTYLFGGCVLFILHTPLVILVTLLDTYSFHYAGVLAYFYALYAFYKIIAAIVNVIKTRKRKLGLVVQTMRNLNFADAMVSILALQTALISAYGEGGMPKANVATGGAICGIVLIGSVYMIVRAIVELVRLRRSAGGINKDTNCRRYDKEKSPENISENESERRACENKENEK